MIYTSYFDNVRKHNLRNFHHISIAGNCPDWYLGYEYKTLAPKWSFFKEYKAGRIDDKEYTRLYHELVLDKLCPNVTVLELYQHVNYDILTDEYADILLLCYEKPYEFCHRHIVSSWLSHAGFNCIELV